MPPANPTAGTTLEDLPLELQAAIVAFLATTSEYGWVSVTAAVALSEVSRACRTAAHTLKHTVHKPLSEACLRALVEGGAWPRVTHGCWRLDVDSVSRLGTVLPLLVARGVGMLTSEAELDTYLADHAATYPISHLSSAGLSRLPKGLPKLAASLTTLDLSGSYYLPKLQASLGRLSALTTLQLANCRALKALPKSIGKLSALTTLNLSGCEVLRALPESIGQLSALITLELGYCEALAALPESIGQLSALTNLNLFHCNSLTALPESLGQLSALTTISLSGSSRVTALPESIGQLGALTSLDLNSCWGLSALLEGLAQLGALTSLECADNLLTPRLRAALEANRKRSP